MTEKVYVNKVESLERDYGRQQKQIEDEIEEVFYEKRKFTRELEELSENYRYHYQQADFSEPIDMSGVYRLLDRGQEEGAAIVKHTVQKSEDKKDDNTVQHRQELKKIEDEWLLLKEEERRKVDE